MKITNLLSFRVLLKEKSVANFDFGLVLQGDNEEITGVWFLLRRKRGDKWSLVPVTERDNEEIKG